VVAIDQGLCLAWGAALPAKNADGEQAAGASSRRSPVGYEIEARMPRLQIPALQGRRCSTWPARLEASSVAWVGRPSAINSARPARHSGEQA